MVLNKNSTLEDRANAVQPGTLYVVATPIGNRDDITLRALKVLGDVDLVAAEDTRKTRAFLELHAVKNKLISYHEHNEAERTPQLVTRLERGESIALVSNAGTPMVSDPGYRLVTEALARNLNVVPIPGVSAAITALSAAGLPTDSFVFVGFTSKKKDRRRQQIEKLASETRTLIFYESAKRILTLLAELRDAMGDRGAVLAREMTKLHEEFIRGRLSEILNRLKERAHIKGECTLLVAGWDHTAAPPSPEEIRKKIEAAIRSHRQSLSDIARDIAADCGISKNQVYAQALEIKKELNSG